LEFDPEGTGAFRPPDRGEKPSIRLPSPSDIVVICPAAVSVQFGYRLLRTVDGEISCKGNMFVGASRAMRTLEGDAFVSSVLEEMRTEGGRAMREGSLLSAGWYPVAWYRDLIGTACKLKDDPFAFRIGVETARADVTTIHRVIFRVLTPKIMLTQSRRLLRLYYSAGDAAISTERDGHAFIRYSGFRGFDAHLWQDFLGGSTTLLELTGAKDIAVKVRGGGTDASMVCETTWR
jgi:hypothetical protein